MLSYFQKPFALSRRIWFSIFKRSKHLASWISKKKYELEIFAWNVKNVWSADEKHFSNFFGICFLSHENIRRKTKSVFCCWLIYWSMVWSNVTVFSRFIPDCSWDRSLKGWIILRWKFHKYLKFSETYKFQRVWNNNPAPYKRFVLEEVTPVS